jgi:hypothetical protein
MFEYMEHQGLGSVYIPNWRLCGWVSVQLLMSVGKCKGDHDDSRELVGHSMSGYDNEFRPPHCILGRGGNIHVPVNIIGHELGSSCGSI